MLAVRRRTSPRRALPSSPDAAPKRRGRLRGRAACAAVAAAALSCSVGGGWWALHRSPAFAALVVNTARAVLGPRAIAWLEERAYEGEDALKRATAGSEPVRYWEPAPQATPADALPAARAGRGFSPAPFAPPFAEVALPDDGAWTPVVDRFGEATMARAMVHPDPRRPFAGVAVVALDLRRLELGAVPGTSEPNAHARLRERAGVVPAGRRGDLVAAFNGGFMAVHGRWGMMVDGVTLLPARPVGCALARYRDGSLRVGTWRRLASGAAEMNFYRQGPPCLIEAGQPNPAALAEDDPEWGVAVGGKAFIRRSAFGLDASGEVGFYAIGDSLTAATLGRALQAAGARDVIQLDVNWAYPHFFFYEGSSDAPRAQSSLITAYGWTPETYVDRADWRDFFFVARRPADGLRRGAAAGARVTTRPKLATMNGI